jgi:hypothetical protein
MKLFKTLAMVGLVGVGMQSAVTPLDARAIRTEDIPFQYQSDSKPFLYAYVEHPDNKPPSILVFDASRQLLKKNRAVDLFGETQKEVGQVVCWMPRSSIIIVSFMRKMFSGLQIDYIAYEVEPTGNIKPVVVTQEMWQQADKVNSNPL